MMLAHDQPRLNCSSLFCMNCLTLHCTKCSLLHCGKNYSLHCSICFLLHCRNLQRVIVKGCLEHTRNK